MRAVPAPVLWIGVRVIRQTADTLVASNSSEVSSFGVDNIPNFSVVGELDSGDHDDTSIPGVKVVICHNKKKKKKRLVKKKKKGAQSKGMKNRLTADKRAFTRRAFALIQVGHSEFDMRRFVKGSGIENSNTVPA